MLTLSILDALRIRQFCRNQSVSAGAVPWQLQRTKFRACAVSLDRWDLTLVRMCSDRTLILFPSTVYFDPKLMGTRVCLECGSCSSRVSYGPAQTEMTFDSPNLFE
jgi:hypothetical protein